PERRPDPARRWGGVRGRDLTEDRGREPKQPGVLLELDELRRVLRQDDVRRRGAPLLEDLGGDDEAVAVPQAHTDPRLPLEGGDEEPRELLVLAVVDDERAPAPAAAC